jgi:hypothetical protein
MTEDIPTDAPMTRPIAPLRSRCETSMAMSVQREHQDKGDEPRAPLEHERHMITRKDVETNKGGEQYVLKNEQAEKLIARKVSTLTHLPDTLLTTAVDQGKIR